MSAMWRATLANFTRENLIFWLPRDTLNRVRPSSFLEHYPNATCIIDCTEIFVQRPKNLGKRAKTYSNYKHHNTYKVLYCIAPNGFVMYVSKLFGGRASDTFILNCGFLVIRFWQTGDSQLEMFFLQEWHWLFQHLHVDVHNYQNMKSQEPAVSPMSEFMLNVQ